MTTKSRLCFLAAAISFMAICSTLPAAADDPLIPAFPEYPPPDFGPFQVLPKGSPTPIPVKQAVEDVFGVEMPDDRVIISDQSGVWPLTSVSTAGPPTDRLGCRWVGAETDIPLPVKRYVGRTDPAARFLLRDAGGEIPAVISLTTLDTPHDGSAGADVKIAMFDAAVARINARSLTNFPLLVSAVLENIMGSGPAYRELTTISMEDYNRDNVSALPSSVTYGVFASDAAQGSAQNITVVDEVQAYAAIPGILPDSTRVSAGNDLYQLMGGISRAEVGPVEICLPFTSLCNTSPGVVATPAPVFLDNDLIVTVSSAEGRTGGFVTVLSGDLPTVITLSNHGNIKRKVIAVEVMENLSNFEEQSHGLE